MKKSEIFSQLINISETTYFRWKKKHKKLIDLLELTFDENEIINYIKTGDAPYFLLTKNEYQTNMAIKYAGYITFDEESNYLYFKFFNSYLEDKKKSPRYYSFQKYLLKMVKTGEISIDQYIQFDFKKFNEQLEFIKLNISTNWKVFDYIVKNNKSFTESRWLPKYNEILFLSAKKNCFMELFCSQNTDDGDYQIVPYPPKLFSYYYNSKKINKMFSLILDDVLNALKTDCDFSHFKKYHFMDGAFKGN